MPSTRKREIYDKAHILEALNTELIGRELHFFKKTGSTNDIALALAGKGCAEGTVVVAESQTKGRGRRGRKWFSPEGGIWMSIVLRSSYHARHPGLLALMGALAVARAINKGIGIEAFVRWPNDVEIKGKKVAGILGEAGGNDESAYAILGIGVNVNIPRKRFPKGLLKTAISLSWACRRKFSRTDLLSLCLTHFEDIYLNSLRGKKGAFIEELKSICSTLGRMVRVEGRRIVEGKAVDIDSSGALLVQQSNGEIARMLSGDVTFL